MHLPCVPILTSLLPLQLAFTHVVGLIWVSPSLNLALRQRLQASIYSLSTTRLPDGATFSVNAGPDVFVYGRGSSPEHARFWSLARWVMTP